MSSLNQAARVTLVFQSPVPYIGAFEDPEYFDTSLLSKTGQVFQVSRPVLAACSSFWKNILSGSENYDEKTLVITDYSDKS